MTKIQASIFIFLMLLTDTSIAIEKQRPHCERKGSDGKMEHLETKDRADCSVKGGNWVESVHKHEQKGGGKHEGHTHE